MSDWLRVEGRWVMPLAGDSQYLTSGMVIRLGEALPFWEPVTSGASDLGAGLDSCLHLLLIEQILP